MFSISESGERAGAEGQEKAAVVLQLRLPWQKPTQASGGWGASFQCCSYGKNKLSKKRPSRGSPSP